MPFNFILDEYPNEVIVDEEIFKVHADFKSILCILQYLNDDLFLDEEKVKGSLALFYGETIPRDTNNAYTEMLDFIHIYRDEKVSNKSNSKKEPRLLDYEIDSGAIYSAFLEKYQIDLTEATMHWFKFNTLLENLSDEKPRLLQLMEIRGMEIDEQLDSKDKARLRKLKKEYSLEEKEEVFGSFADAFLFGAKAGGKQ
ncbi:MAG: Gp15 family bacteriophage protein [Erysipelothrix sp.]